MGSEKRVLVSEREPRLCYHRTGELGSTWDMIEVTEEDAQAMGAVPCSQCFVKQDAVQYPFPYLTT